MNGTTMYESQKNSALRKRLFKTYFQMRTPFVTKASGVLFRGILDKPKVILYNKVENRLPSVMKPRDKNADNRVFGHKII